MPYKYLRDPLFLFCLGLYFLNRWCLKPRFTGGFFHNSLNDLICIPFWVPILLWGMRKVGIRPDDSPPRWHEILIPLLVWSIVFERLVPQMQPLQHLAHADVADIWFYTLGACGAAVFWRTWYDRKGLRAGECPAAN